MQNKSKSTTPDKLARCNRFHFVYDALHSVTLYIRCLSQNMILTPQN